MKLQIQNKVINTPLINILTKLQNDCNGNFVKDIKEQRKDILITCPFHKQGQENHPSCSVHSRTDTDEVFGTYHCWSCGAKGTLSNLVGFCLKEDGDEWLLDNFGNTFIDETEFLEEIDIDKTDTYLDKSVLNVFDYSNEKALDYLINKRHLRKEVIDYFCLGYNKETDSITFPIFNEHECLVGISERNVDTKRFNLPEVSPKPVYLLHEAKKYKTVYVCESQINALTLWGWGYPAVALFGTGSKAQYEILNRSGIFHYILCFDGDKAGEEGRKRFNKNINPFCFVSWKDIPKGKDVNDLTLEEFNNLGIL